MFDQQEKQKRRDRLNFKKKKKHSQRFKDYSNVSDVQLNLEEEMFEILIWIILQRIQNGRIIKAVK